MKSSNVKESVVDSYSKLAKLAGGNLVTKLFGCCDLSGHSKAVATAIGYSNEEMQNVPDESNLGVGCGNPSAIANIKAGETVVDLGSGAGFDAFIVSNQVGPSGQVIGIDLSDEMLALANRNALKMANNTTTFLKGDIEEIPLDDNLADHVISNCVINLSNRKDKVYEEAYRILKPGGKMSISDVILERELPDFVKNSLAGQVACVSGAEKLDTYINYVKAAGFKDIQIVDKKEFPLELMLLDPQIVKIAKLMNFDLNSDEAKDIASRVKSISLVATK